MSTRPALTGPQVRRAVDISRRTGAPLLGCLLNLERAPSALGGVGLQADHRINAVTGLLDIAVAADFALGYSVRQATHEARWAVPTIGLSLNLTAELPVSGAARVSATRATVHGSMTLSSAAGLLHTSTGASIGHCSAVFATPHNQPAEPLPWEELPNDSEALSPSGVDEQSNADATVQIICEAVALANQQDKSWLDVLLGLVSPVLVRGVHTERVFCDSALVANRAGYVQGGVLFALGAGPPLSDSAEPFCGDMKFVRPARADLPVRVETNIGYRGRRTEFALSHLYQNDKLLATGSFAFKRR